MSPHLSLHLLGPPQLYLDNIPIISQRRKAVALMAYLAIEQGRRTRDSLSTLFWPDYEQSKAYSNLRHTLWEIQRSIGGDWLVTDRETVGLNEEADIRLDVRKFQSLLTLGKECKEASRRVALLADAIRLYRDHFMSGFTLKDTSGFDEWVFYRSEDLREQFAGALIDLSEEYCSLDQADKAIPHGRRLVVLDPLDESSHRHLMKIYMYAGRQSAALKQYQVCEEILRKELNLDPQPETYALYKQIRKGWSRSTQVEKQDRETAPQQSHSANSSTWIESDEITGRLEIRDGTGPDPTVNLYVPDAWIRWLLLAAEEKIGKLSLRVVLQKAGLEHLIGNYPPYERPRPSKKFTFGDYAAINAGLLDFYGREGEIQLLDMGRASIKHSVTEQGALYGIGTANFPGFASLSSQLKMGMEVILEAARKASQSIGQEHHLFLEDRGDRLAYIVQECVFCAGKQSNKPMCMYLSGNLQEGLRWMTGEVVHVEEVECRAMGAEACVWEIGWEPKGQKKAR